MKNSVMKMVNGFNPEEIVSTINAIQANPDIAKFEFRVRNNWVTGGHNEAMVKDFYGGGKEDDSRVKPWIFANDEPPILLGQNKGANPVEYLLSALSGCMTTTMALHAAVRGMEIESIASKFTGDIDVQGFLGLSDKVRNGYNEIQVSFDIKGKLTEEQKMELIEFTRQSPVYDVVTNGTKVRIELA